MPVKKAKAPERLVVLVVSLGLLLLTAGFAHALLAPCAPHRVADAALEDSRADGTFDYDSIGNPCYTPCYVFGNGVWAQCFDHWQNHMVVYGRPGRWGASLTVDCEPLLLFLDEDCEYWFDEVVVCPFDRYEAFDP